MPQKKVAKKSAPERVRDLFVICDEKTGKPVEEFPDRYYVYKTAKAAKDTMERGDVLRKLVFKGPYKPGGK